MSRGPGRPGTPQRWSKPTVTTSRSTKTDTGTRTKTATAKTVAAKPRAAATRKSPVSHEPRITTRTHRSTRSKTASPVEETSVASEIEVAPPSEIDEVRERPTADLDEVAASADLVRSYLNEIGKVALLSAVEEVELSKRIEAGLFAGHLLSANNNFGAAKKRDLRLLIADGERAKDHLLRANLRLVVSLAKR